MDFSETLPNSMFSRPMFSDLSMEPQASEDVAIYDIVSFLALAQQCGLDLLPIKWQPALGVLGKGGTAAVNQSLINVQMSYAFKRVLPLRAVKSGFREWASELLILCHSWMRTNYRIARLEAFCLEVLKDGRVSPVLIFEKAELGDLEHFVTLEEANAISFDGWLELCLGLGRTLHNMQWFGIIHGDFKPSNVLVFRDGCGGFLFKIADFGFAVKKEQQNLILPIGRTRLWAAPEHSSRRFTVKEADRMDWYSFGLTCFWLLIRKLRSRSLHDRGEEFNVSTMEKLKARNELLSFAEKVMEQDLTLSADQKHHLSRFFSSYLALDPKNRAPMIHLLYDTLEDQSPKQPLRVPIISSDISQIVEESKLLHPVSVTSELVDSHPHFQMKDFIFGLALADYRIRVGVVDALHETYQNSQCLTCKRNAAFQLALCTFIPFGHLRRPEHFSVWISRSGSSQGDLESELDGIRRTIDPTAKQSKISDIASEYLFAVDPAQEYRDLPSDEFTVIKRAVSEELQGCRTLLGETHSITVTLTRTLAGMMNGKGMFDDAMSVQQSLIQALKGDLQVLKVKMDLSLTLSFKGRLKEVEALRSEVVARLQETIGYDHVITLSAMAGLASVLSALGRSPDAEQLLLKVIDAQKRKLGPDHFSTLASMSVLVAIYCSQLRLKEAEELQSHIVKMRKKILGDKHAHTWTSQLNMAAILSMQGRLKEAELLELEVIDRRIQHLGAEHPETLTAMSNLAVTYRNQKRWKEEEATLFQIIAAREKVLGREHPDTMVTAQALANNYLNQGRPNDAETWGTYAAFKEIDGRAIANMTTLAWARFDQGHQDKAEEQLLHAINTGKEGLGECNGDVLNCMRHLAMMNKCRGRLLEAKQLHDHVWKMRQKVLGDNHKDTLRSRQQLEEVESLIQRRAEEHPK